MWGLGWRWGRARQRSTRTGVAHCHVGRTRACTRPAQAIRKASAQVGELDAITTFCELAVPLASRLAEKLGLPHNTPDGVDAARDKVCVCVRRRMGAPGQMSQGQLACLSQHGRAACVCVLTCVQHLARELMVKAGLPTPKHYRIVQVCNARGQGRRAAGAPAAPGPPASGARAHGARRPRHTQRAQRTGSRGGKASRGAG